MLCFRPLLFSIVAFLLVFSSLPFSFSSEEDTLFTSFQISGQDGVVFSWVPRERLLAESNSSETEVNSTLVLAARRTNRKDPLDHFHRYSGGWNISNRHYWASVGYTAVPLFVGGGIWFVVFGLCSTLLCCCFCCCRRQTYGYSRLAYALSLGFLSLFTLAAVIGCVVLYTGQGKFHRSTMSTLDYVVGQANATSDGLRNVSGYLAAAKQINVDRVFLPPNVQTDIDVIQDKINSSATMLSSRTRDNSEKIKNLIESVRLALIILSAVMLILTFLGFVFSVFGLQFLVYILVITGWILVTGTFVLCGVFVLLHNVTGDTCVAMNEWVQNPAARTALDDILPCVDNATAQETLTKSKEVTSQLVGLMNMVVTNISNHDFPPNFGPFYFNQSGPLVPNLCSPFNTDRVCAPGEVDLDNATTVWNGYTCRTSESGVCWTRGRLTAAMFGQMSAAVNVSYGLYRYGPFLVELEDCSFVRRSFSTIHGSHCPGLRKYSRWIYIGLVMVASAVMFSLLFWVLYGRERRHRVYTKAHTPPLGQGDNKY